MPPTPRSCTFTTPGPTDDSSLQSLTNTEWLLTAGNGGFAMGTASGIPTRRYHGLLVASLRPPVNRVMALSAVAETVVVDGARFELANFRFSGGVTHPRGYTHLERFEKDGDAGSVRWRYRCDTRAGAVAITKSLHRARQQPGSLIHYHVSNATGAPLQLTLQPLVALRDFHGLLLRDLNPNRFTVTPAEASVAVAAQGGATITLAAGAPARFVRHEEWWYNFFYSVEAGRGYDSLEDLFSPGWFTADIPAGESELSIQAVLATGGTAGTHPLRNGSLHEAEAAHADRLSQILASTRHTLGPAFFPGGPLEHHPLLEHLPTLVAAADAFVIRRVRPGALPGAPADRVSIIAGYPWFADWGRDSMISLPGLILSCGRFAEARAVLETFAGACKDGLIPNVFDDYTGAPHYNTVDASLWFVHA
ncbi:MAG TPA: glycogen debranching enzyme N-terminal domain-containing protein, partial [Phycisphaerales bacterium]|nr:glycogen debranching enzyme N-terminal domain-containing protein [Phycisphaerales bacterium]